MTYLMYGYVYTLEELKEKYKQSSKSKVLSFEDWIDYHDVEYNR